MWTLSAFPIRHKGNRRDALPQSPLQYSRKETEGLLHDLKEGWMPSTPTTKEALSHGFEGGEATWREAEQDRIPGKKTGCELTYRETISALHHKDFASPKVQCRAHSLNSTVGTLQELLKSHKPGPLIL